MKKKKASGKVRLRRAAIVLSGIAIVSLIGAAVFYFSTREPRITEGPVSSMTVLSEEVLRSFEIAAITYNYTDLIFVKDAKELKLGDSKIKLPGTKSALGVKYDGIIKIGIDGSKIKMTQNGNSIQLTLPPVEMLSHAQDPDSVEVVLDESGIFSKNSVLNYVELMKAKTDEMEQKAKDMGLFEQARESAEAQLKAFLYSIPSVKDNYTVTFV
ncbi:MAG: DUF4230 domain-containing protein [Oscillospiraceae bacterium]|nr:DUF4230 domain-containing protein [Oscillospiraceae bacterium]